MLFAVLNGIYGEEQLFTFLAGMSIREFYPDFVTTIGKIIEYPPYVGGLRVVCHLNSFCVFFCLSS